MLAECIRLFEVEDHCAQAVQDEVNAVAKLHAFPPGGISSLHLLMLSSNESSLVARGGRVPAHDYEVNSISNNSDGETFISVDGLRKNLWNLEMRNSSYNIAGVKPQNIEDLIAVITSAGFQPRDCNSLAYSSSNGSIRLVDLLQSALCDSLAKLFEEQAHGSRSFFTEMVKDRFGNGKKRKFSEMCTKVKGLANPKTVSVQAGDNDSVVLAATKTRKQSKSASLQHKSVMNKEFCWMAKAVENQVGDDHYRPDMKQAALAV